MIGKYWINRRGRFTSGGRHTPCYPTYVKWVLGVYVHTQCWEMTKNAVNLSLFSNKFSIRSISNAIIIKEIGDIKLRLYGHWFTATNTIFVLRSIERVTQMDRRPTVTLVKGVGSVGVTQLRPLLPFCTRAEILTLPNVTCITDTCTACSCRGASCTTDTCTIGHLYNWTFVQWPVLQRTHVHFYNGWLYNGHI